MESQKTQTKDFIEIKFTGYVNGKIFDSNISEDLSQLSSEAKPEKTIVCIGEKMVVPGFDKGLINKEINNFYEINIPYNEGFGKRHRELIKTIPLKVFTSQKINPKPGITLLLDNQLARIITISGARVLTDFNNPLAGKDLKYKFKIIRIVTDLKEKTESLFKYFIKHIPEIEILEKKIIIKGPKPLENILKMYISKFAELLGSEIEFKLDEKIQSEKVNNQISEISK